MHPRLHNIIALQALNQKYNVDQPGANDFYARKANTWSFFHIEISTFRLILDFQVKTLAMLAEALCQVLKVHKN